MADESTPPGVSYAEAIKSLSGVIEMVVKPFATVAQTYADRHRINTLTPAEIACADLKLRAQMNAEVNLLRHQQNLEAIVEQTRAMIEDKAARKLLPEQAGKGESDPDWIHKWAGYAKETSDQDIRTLWAKVLAGEVIEPGKYSLRLLQLINLLRKDEARDFELFANFVWKDTDGSLLQPYSLHSESYLRTAYGVHRSFYPRLSNLGLITDFGRDLLTEPSLRSRAWLTYGNRCYSFELVNIFETREPIRVRDVTPVGAELFELCQPKPDPVYAERVTQGVRERGMLGGWNFEETEID